MNFFLVILFTSIFSLLGCLKRDQELNPTVVPCPIEISIVAEPLESKGKMRSSKTSKKPSSSSIRCKSKIVSPKKISAPTPLSKNAAKIDKNSNDQTQKDDSSKSRDMPTPTQIQTTPAVEVLKLSNAEKTQESSSILSPTSTVSSISTSSSTDSIIPTSTKDVLSKDSSVSSDFTSPDSSIDSNISSNLSNPEKTQEESSSILSPTSTVSSISTSSSTDSIIPTSTKDVLSKDSSIDSNISSNTSDIASKISSIDGATQDSAITSISPAADNIQSSAILGEGVSSKDDIGKIVENSIPKTEEIPAEKVIKTEK